MDQIQMLFGPAGGGLWLFALAAGAAVALLVWGGVAISAVLMDPVRRRLQALREAPSGLPARDRGVPRGVGRIWTWFEPPVGKEREALIQSLNQAGFRSREAIGMLFTAKWLLLLVLPLTVLVLHLAKFQLSGTMLAIALLGAAWIGTRLPNYVLEYRRDKRQSMLMAGMPDALDLLVTCTEAGLSLNGALERVVDQLPESHPELANELAQVNAEVRVGVDRGAALRNLADRTGLDEIRGLVSLLSHSTRLGTGVAETLRIFAEEFRDRRMQRAEELAATVGTKLIFPLVLCLFPSFFVVVIGPAVISLMHSFSTQLSGG